MSELLMMSASVLMAMSVHIGFFQYRHPLIGHSTYGASFPLSVDRIGCALDSYFRFHVINGETIRNAEIAGAALLNVTLTLIAQLFPVFVRGGVYFVGVVLN